MPVDPVQTGQHKKALLAAFAQSGNLSASCLRCGVGRQTHYDWIRDDPEYVEAFAVARKQASEFLEDVATSRATDGWEEPVWYEGHQCGTVRKFSDTLLIFLMKGNNPEKFRERFDVKHDGKIETTHKFIKGVDGEAL